MEKSNFALRLLPSLHKAGQRVSERENCSLNQLINIALAEKIAVLDDGYWRDRRMKASKMPRSTVLRRLAGNEKPREGDELPEGAVVKQKTNKAKILTAGGR
jgi:hypothetical protein